jgi:uncharacterized protein YhjY with autotransporter beta-barrel domain
MSTAVRASAFLAFSVAVMSAGAGSAMAGTVTLNVPSANIASASNTVLDARYRLSNTNFDHMLAKSSDISGATIVQSRNTGTHNNLNGAIFDFALSYTPVAGWTFTKTHVSGGSPAVTSSTLTFNAPFNGDSPFRSFNGFELFAVVGSLPSGVTAATASAYDLTFSAPGHSVIGTLADVTSTGGLVNSWIYADFDLSTTSFTLAGKLRHSFVGSTGSNMDERVKFDIKAATVTLVPTPGAAFGVALLGLAAARRRR